MSSQHSTTTPQPEPEPEPPPRILKVRDRLPKRSSVFDISIFAAVFGPFLGDDMKATLLSKAGRPSLGQRFTSYDVLTSWEGWGRLRSRNWRTQDDPHHHRKCQNTACYRLKSGREGQVASFGGRRTTLNNTGIVKTRRVTVLGGKTVAQNGFIIGWARTTISLLLASPTSRTPPPASQSPRPRSEDLSQEE